MDGQENLSFGANFRKFFVRGLAILLPTVLTIWILLAAYQFVQIRIAKPINEGVKEAIVRLTPYPLVSKTQVNDHKLVLLDDPTKRAAYRAVEQEIQWLERDARRTKLGLWWNTYAPALDLIGLVLAIVLIYISGVLLTSFIGRRLYHRGEELINRVPLIRRVYPSVKQVTDFIFGDKDKLKFSRVVAVEYPRKGLWSVGLVTGQTMRNIQDQAANPCLTVFIPSSPTPFTGYVITVPAPDTIDLPVSVEDAMKFTISAGVLIPPNQQIPAVPEPATAIDGRDQTDAPAQSPTSGLG